VTRSLDAARKAAGDIASMPKNVVTTWHVSPGYKELWVLAENR